MKTAGSHHPPAVKVGAGVFDRRVCACKSPVEWAMDGQGTTVEHMRVDHGCFDVFVAEEFLDGANVIAVFEEIITTDK